MVFIVFQGIEMKEERKKGGKKIYNHNYRDSVTK